MNKIPATPDIQLVREILRRSTVLDEDDIIKKVFADLAFHVYRMEEFIIDDNNE